MSPSTVVLISCFISCVTGFRRVLRPDVDHIGRSFHFLAAEPEDLMDDALMKGNPVDVEEGFIGSDISEDEISPSIPLAMQLLLKETENDIVSKVRTAQSEREDFTPVAKYLVPDSVHPGSGKSIVINFVVPQEYGEEFGKNRTVWLILTLVNDVGQSDLPIEVTIRENRKSKDSVPMVTSKIDSSKHFVIFNVTSHVKCTFKNQSKSFSLSFWTSEPLNRRPVRAMDVVELNGSGKGPILVSTALQDLSGIDMPRALKRKKRRARRETVPEMSTTAIPELAPATTDATAVNHCRLEEWAPTKDELGWNWLVHPERVPVNFCSGICPSPLLNSHFNASSNAVARDYYRTIIKGGSSLDHPNVHCVPISYRRLTVLIESSPGVFSIEVASTLAVSQCGCR